MKTKKKKKAKKEMLKIGNFSSSFFLSSQFLIQ